MVSSVLCQRTTVTRGLLCPSHAVRKLFAASNLALASWGLCAFVHRSRLPHTQSCSPVHRYLGLVILHASLLISVHWGLPRIHVGSICERQAGFTAPNFTASRLR